jgi:hypothetical protein
MIRRFWLNCTVQWRNFSPIRKWSILSDRKAGNYSRKTLYRVVSWIKWITGHLVCIGLRSESHVCDGCMHHDSRESINLPRLGNGIPVCILNHLMPHWQGRWPLLQCHTFLRITLLLCVGGWRRRGAALLMLTRWLTLGESEFCRHKSTMFMGLSYVLLFVFGVLLARFVPERDSLMLPELVKCYNKNQGTRFVL